MNEFEKLVAELLSEVLGNQLNELRDSCPLIELSDPYIIGDRINVTMSMDIPKMKGD